MKRRIARLLGKSIPCSRLRYDDLKYYIEEGYGGQPLERWPVYHFFRDYMSGHRVKAFNDFVHWYQEQFTRYYNVPKNLGGMYKGSLYRLIEQKYSERGLAFHGGPWTGEETLVKETIEERVKQRFRLVDEIVSSGYSDKSAEIITGVRKGEYVYLKRGHHRSAILALLDYPSIPNVLVFPSYSLYSLWKGIVRLQEWLVSRA
jgi:hypothetical protein